MNLQLELKLNDPRDVLSNEEILEKYIDYIEYYLNNDSIPYLDEYVHNDTPDISFKYDYYCKNCMCLLKKFKCPKCKKLYDRYKYIRICNDKFDINHKFGFFNIINNDVYLYIITYKTCFPILVDRYLILKDAVYSFNDLEYYEYDYKKYLVTDFDRYTKIKLFYEEHYVYYLFMDNLDEINNHELYKYSFFKEIINYIYYINKAFNIQQLSRYPVHCKAREYLYKLGLYRLAIWGPDLIEEGKTFYDKFKIDKKYLPFMIKNNIRPYELDILQCFPTNNQILFDFYKKIYSINCCSDCSQLPNELFFLDHESFYEYYLKNKKYKNFLTDYNDYFRMIVDMRLDLSDDKILFPDNFKEARDAVYKEYLLVKDKDIAKKIKDYSKLYSINTYEDDKYIIFPAKDVESLIDESNQMSNCVRTYTEAIAAGACEIFFMREKCNVNKSLVTIEVRDNKVVQARSKFNNDLTSEQSKIVNKFETQLVSINVI